MKKMRSWCVRLLVVTMTAVAAGMLWAATVVICPKCGYESDGTSAICAHCGGPLPLSKSAVLAATTPTPAPGADAAMDEMSATALKAARADVKQAKEFMASRPEVSYAFYENAIALSRLVKRVGEAGDGHDARHDRNIDACLRAPLHEVEVGVGVVEELRQRSIGSGIHLAPKVLEIRPRIFGLRMHLRVSRDFNLEGVAVLLANELNQFAGIGELTRRGGAHRRSWQVAAQCDDPLDTRSAIAIEQCGNAFSGRPDAGQVRCSFNAGVLRNG